eukprot:4299082-Pyramimonas_sp.AAC.1
MTTVPEWPSRFTMQTLLESDTRRSGPTPRQNLAAVHAQHLLNDGERPISPLTLLLTAMAKS